MKTVYNQTPTDQGLRKVSNAVMKVVDLILPPRCGVSGDVVREQGMSSPESWATLEFIHDPFCARCGMPFESEEEAEMNCIACADIDDAFSFDSARAAVKYNDTSRKMVLDFKHADKIHILPVFLPWLLRAGKDMLAEADLLVPVPLHRWRLLRRRYNQAALIAKGVGREAGVKCVADLLRRVRSTPSQGYLKAHERAANVRRAFAVNPKFEADIKGKTIVLVDDVYTTGSTVKECASVLKAAGAAKVHVLAVARVVRF